MVLSAELWEVRPLHWFWGPSVHSYYAMELGSRGMGASPVKSPLTPLLHLYSVVFLQQITFTCSLPLASRVLKWLVFIILPFFIFLQLLLCRIKVIKVLTLPFCKFHPICKVLALFSWIIFSYKACVAKRIKNIFQQKILYMIIRTEKFVLAKKWKQTKYSSAGEWTNKLWYKSIQWNIVPL